MKTFAYHCSCIGSIEGPNFLHSHGDNNVCNNGILCHLMPPWLLFPQPRHLLSPCPIDLQDFNKRLFVTKIWKKSYLAPPDDATPPFSTCVCCVVLGWTWSKSSVFGDKIRSSSGEKPSKITKFFFLLKSKVRGSVFRRYIQFSCMSEEVRPNTSSVYNSVYL